MIEKAVIPAAGFGSRVFPLTIAVPKELLPIIDKPMIQFSIDEAIDSEIKNIAIVIRKGKIAIKKYVTTFIDEGHTGNICYIQQPKPNGLGSAILKSKKWINDDPFSVLLPDDIIVDTEPCAKRLISLHKKYGCSIIAVEKVNDVKKYGIIKGIEINENIYRVDDLIEKPTILNAPSNVGIVGRYILTPEIFSCLRKLVINNTKNIELTDAIRLLLEKEDVYAYKIEGKRYDCGNIEGYTEALIDFVLEKREKTLGVIKNG